MTDLATHVHQSGLRTVVARQSGTGVVAIQVWVGVGSADETEAQGGLAHVHEHMLFKGTSEQGPRGGKVRRGVGQIASEIEGAGGEINAWTSYDQTVYHVVIQRQLLDTGLDVLADAVLRSSFDPDELARELEVILEEIKRSNDQPSTKASRAMFKSAFTAHPYRRPVIGYAEVVSGFKRDHIVDFFDTHYRADRMTVVVVGDVDPEETHARIEKAFAGARAGAAPLLARATEPAQSEIRAHVLGEDIEESQLLIGWPGPSLLADDMPACDVLAVILGQGESSRLVTRVKRQKQLANEAYAYAYTPKDPGLIAVGAHLHHDKLEPCFDALLEEVRRIREDKVRASEIEKAKALLASESIYQKETVEGLARRLGTWMNATNDPAYEAQYQARVQQVTADDVRAAAEKYLRTDGANVVALLPKGEEARVSPESLIARTRTGLAAQKRSVRAADAVVLVELKNGSRVIVERDARNPIVTARAVWLGGLRAEDDAHAGHTALCSDLVVKGTPRISASAMHEQLDHMASHIDGFAGRNSFGMRGTFLKKHSERGLEMFFESLRDASFAPDELERTRALVLEDLRTKADNPAGVAFELFGQHLWPTHPYRRDLSGTPETVKAATSEALRGFWQSHAVAQGCVLSFVGDVEPDEVIALVEQSMPERPGVGVVAPKRDPVPAKSSVVRREKDRAQAHLVTGTTGLMLDMIADKHALEVITSSLSGQGGRLFLELRDKQSLCYSVSAYAIEGIDPGSFSVYMGTSPDKVATALAGIERLLADVCDNGLKDDEIARAQRYLVGAHEIGLQRLGARASAMALNELYGLGHLVHREYAARIHAVTRDDVRRIAQHILTQPRVTSIVGPKGTTGPDAT